MGVLRILAPIAAFLLINASSARGEGSSLLTGMDAGASGSAGAGSLYTIGGDLTLLLGSTGDMWSRTGDLHVSYLDQFSPRDVSTPSGPLKQSHSWNGGISASLWEGGSVGIDLDSLSDLEQAIAVDGTRISVGQGPVRLAYRYSRIVVRNSFSVPLVSRSLTLDGAFTYQHTFSASSTFEIGARDSLQSSVSASFFQPDAAAFANLLSLPALYSISSFGSVLESFEDWSAGIDWRHDWSDRWDTTVGGRWAHLIIGRNPLLQSNLGVGYRLSHGFRIRGIWDYSHDPLSHSSVWGLEVRFGWQRE